MQNKYGLYCEGQRCAMRHACKSSFIGEERTKLSESPKSYAIERCDRLTVLSVRFRMCLRSSIAIACPLPLAFMNNPFGDHMIGVGSERNLTTDGLHILAVTMTDRYK